MLAQHIWLNIVNLLGHESRPSFCIGLKIIFWRSACWAAQKIFKIENSHQDSLKTHKTLHIGIDDVESDSANFLQITMLQIFMFFVFVIIYFFKFLSPKCLMLNIFRLIHFLIQGKRERL